MVEILDKLKDCLYCGSEDFTYWLLKSNCSKVGPYLKEDRFENMRQYVVYTCLEEILDVLIKNPEADYFWYTYPQHGGELTWSEPHHHVVPSDSLRVDKQKIKILLRDIKINQILNAI
jgi:hypothetical protein